MGDSLFLIDLNLYLEECCRCGNYSLLNSLCTAMNISIKNLYFDNDDSILHRCIQWNNRQLTSELIRYGFNIDIDGEIGSPLVTAIHYDILWAVEFLLNHGADLTKRHIDWPLLTLYQYCIQFKKIDTKLIIDRYIALLIRQNNDVVLRKLINDGWNISLKRRRYHHHHCRLKKLDAYDHEKTKRREKSEKKTFL